MNYIHPIGTRDFKYFDEFTTDVTITIWQPNDDATVRESYKVTLTGAFPVTMDDISLDHSSEEFIKVSMSLAYINWKIDKFPSDKYKAGELFETFDSIDDLLAAARSRSSSTTSSIVAASDMSGGSWGDASFPGQGIMSAYNKIQNS